MGSKFGQLMTGHRMKKLLCFLVVAFLFYPCLSYSKTLYVNGATGNDATTYVNNTAEAPWATIGRAAWGSTSYASPNTAQAAQAGDTVLVTAGTYTTAGDTSGNRWTVALNAANNGTSGSSPITFRGVGTVYIRMASGSRGPMIGSNSKNYIVWDNFYIDDYYGGSSSDTGPVVLYNQTGSQIINCTVKGHSGSYYNGFPTFTGNYNAIRLEYAHYSTVKNCTIFQITGGENEAGIMFYDSDYNTIENNIIYSNGSGIYVKGVRSANTQDYNIIRKNIIYLNSVGLILLGGNEGKVYQNIFRDNDVSLDMNAPSETQQNNKIVNNVFARVTGSGSNGLIRTRGTSATGYPGALIQNNIFTNTGTFAVIADVAYGSTNTNITFEHNNYYNFPASKLWYSEGAASKSFAQWKADFGKDDLAPDSITTDPLFVDATGNDFKLQAGSPALTLGVDILDLDGDGSTTDTIPAGAYITGNETIGIGSSIPATVEGLTIRGGNLN
jgi:parallel beta-helix repeat protein